MKFLAHFPWTEAGEPVPTHFYESITKGLFQTNYGTALAAAGESVGIKKHSIRRIKDGVPRYGAGMTLHMAILNMGKETDFAEVECTAVQHAKMYLQPMGDGYLGYSLCVDVNGRPLSTQQIKDLARNDGMKPMDFARWFTIDLLLHGTSEYELVHWTYLRYL